MRECELNATGFMHNRVRMITASFLIKHLLTDWRIGEAYFAEKLMDYDLVRIMETGNGAQVQVVMPLLILEF
jgi:deoxyribodipyrimidine photolyase